MKPQIIVTNPNTISKKKIRREEDKFFASKNNTQYNLNIAYLDKARTIIKSLSIGFVLKEIQNNENNPSVIGEDTKYKEIRLRDEYSKIAGICVYYNFVNKYKHDLTDYQNNDKTKKVVLKKNTKLYYYGVVEINTTNVVIKVSKVAEVYLLFREIAKQIQENESNIKAARKNKKEFPDNPQLSELLRAELARKTMLKAEFINMVKNMIKRFF
jgi:hypothetical protein